MTRLALVLWLGLTTGWAPPAGARPQVRAVQPAAPSQLERAAQSLKAGRLEQAEAGFSAWIASHPKDARGYYGRGDTLARAAGDSNKLRRALQDFDRVLELEPRQNAVFFLKRGQVLSNLDRENEAVADFNRALECQPDAPLTLALRGRSLWALGQTLAALADLDRALELDPRLALARGLRGAARLRIGQLEDALEDLELAVILDPSSPFRGDLEELKERLKSLPPIGPWERFVSPDEAFELCLPTPIRVRLLEREMTVAAVAGRGHIYGVVRHVNELPPGAMDLASAECRAALFQYLERDGGKIENWKIEPFAGYSALHVGVKGSDRTITDVMVLVTDQFTYLVAAVRRQDSKPFHEEDLARFRQSFKIFR